MQILKSFLNAISMYSALPVPYPGEWKKEDLQYSILFFPAVGAVIGILLWLWSRADLFFEWKNLVGGTLISAAIPVAVTGGIHIDGYMDTSDALHSWRSRERKLEILKDSHIGAFAVIRLLVIAVLYASGCSVLVDSLYRGRNGASETFEIWCVSFIMSRVLSGFSVIHFKNARGSGSLYTFADASAGHGRGINIWLAAEYGGCLAAILLISPLRGAAAAAAALLSFLGYHHTAYKQFGGITGDIAGWFLVRCETAVILVLAVCERIGI